MLWGFCSRCCTNPYRPHAKQRNGSPSWRAKPSQSFSRPSGNHHKTWGFFPKALKSLQAGISVFSVGETDSFILDGCFRAAARRLGDHARLGSSSTSPRGLNWKKMRPQAAGVTKCRARGRTPTAPEGGRDPRDAVRRALFLSHNDHGPRGRSLPLFLVCFQNFFCSKQKNLHALNFSSISGQIAQQMRSNKIADKPNSII